MKQIFTILSFTALFSIGATAQSSFVQITTGAGYQSQTFYSFKTDAIKTIKNTDWDLAFTVFGGQDAGVFINEASGSVAGQPIPNIELFAAPTNTYSDKIVETDIKIDAPIYNNEKNKSWTNGAFNELKDKTKPFDYGWGVYSPATNTVVGNKLFVVKLRDGKYRKFEIQSLAGTPQSYSVRHAALDGSDEKKFTVEKSKFSGKTLAYYSFSNNTVLDIEPQGGFDILYTRYISLVTQAGVTAQYKVTGILMGAGVSAVKLTGVEPSKVKFNDYKAQLSSQVDTIGIDWKSVDINTGKWTVPSDRAYFVKTKSNDVYKMVFVDFEGASSGTATFEKTFIVNTTSLNNIAEDIKYKVFPTIVSNQLNVMFDAKSSENVKIDVIDMVGREVSVNNITSTEGLQIFSIDATNLATGSYIVRLSTKEGIATSKIVKQ